MFFYKCIVYAIGLHSFLRYSLSNGFVPTAPRYFDKPNSHHHFHLHQLRSSFYGKFEGQDFDEEEDDDDDDDEYDSLLDNADVDSFRSKMSSMFGDGSSDTTQPPPISTDTSAAVDELIRLATGQESPKKNDDGPWARTASAIAPGTILVANPRVFCDDLGDSTTKNFSLPFGNKRSSQQQQLLNKVGLGFSPPAELGPDRRADLLPVILVVEQNSATVRAVLLNRRTGYLLGDLEEQQDEPPLLEKFCIQPLWLGGIDAGDRDMSGSVGRGLDMLHLCPHVEGATQLTEDGLFWGGDPSQAQEAMDASAVGGDSKGEAGTTSSPRVYTGFDFKFFVQHTVFKPKELEKYVASDTFFVTHVASPLLFQSRDRMGTRRAKPLWTEIMELLGGEYTEIKDELYETE